MITKRQLNIFSTILYSDRMVVLQELMALTNKSERTVQYDISSLRTNLKRYDIQIRSVNQGLYIPINQHVRAEQVLHELENELLNLNDEVYKESIIHELLLLLASNKYTTMHDLTSYLHMSDRLIYDYIKLLEEHYNSKVLIKNERGLGYVLKGNEFFIRKAMIHAIRSFTGDDIAIENWLNLLPISLESHLNKVDLSRINTRYREVNLKYRVWLNKDMFNTLLSYLIVITLRQYLVNENSLVIEKSTMSKITLQYIHELLDGMIDVNPLEEQYLMLIFNESNIVIKDVLYQDSKLDKLMDEIEDFVSNHRLKFNIHQLTIDLKLHFQTYLRSDSLADVENELILRNVREQYAQYYEVAEVIGYLFARYFKKLNESELSLITIYLYKNRIGEDVRKRIIVVCGTGKGLSTLLVTRIQNVFPQLDVVATMSYYQIERLDINYNADFVVTTLPLKNSKIPTIEISSVLSVMDIRKISNYLQINYRMVEEKTENDLEKSVMIDTDFLPKQNEMQYYSELVGSTILSMIELITSIQHNYPMGYDTILGLVIHLSMGISRWYGDGFESVQFDEKALVEIEHQYPDLTDVMNVFFLEVENKLMLEIPAFERFAIYQYILKRKKDSDGNEALD